MIQIPENILKEEILPVQKDKKSISILITAYNAQEFIEECLDSIESQTYFKENSDYEILLGIDRCKKTLHKIEEIYHKYRNLRVFMMEENVGTYVTTNTLLNISQYDNIIRFDSDDIMLPQMVNEIMSESDKYDFIRYGFLNLTGQSIFLSSFWPACGSVFYKKNFIDAAGGYKGWKCSADLELIKRMSLSDFRMGQIEKRLFIHRKHKDSLASHPDTKLRGPYRTGVEKKIRVLEKNENFWLQRKISSFEEKIFIPFNKIPDPVDIESVPEEKVEDKISQKDGISIIITAWQTQEFIEQCLDSIEFQTYFKNNDRYEILLGIDGCETTLSKVKDIKEKYRNLKVLVMNENVGTYITSNTLLNLVKYDNIIRFDSDDYMTPGMVEEIMKKSLEYDFIRFFFYDLEEPRNFRPRSFLAMGAVFYKKWVMDKAGGYQPWICNADLELLKRLENSKVRFGEIKNPLFCRRVRPSSLSEKAETSLKSLFRRKLTKRIKKYKKGEDIRIEKIVSDYYVLEEAENIDDKPGVSIIITAWQTQDYIEECLDSVKSQTYFRNNNNFEVLVGVDGCQDTLNKLLQIRHKYRNLRIFMMKENKGTYITSNTLLMQSTFENILRIDSDDILHTDLVFQVLIKSKYYDVIRYKVKNFGTYQKNTNESFAYGTLFFKKNLVKTFGAWKPWLCHADKEFFLRIEKHVKTGYINEILYNRRIHPNSLTRKKETSGNSDLRKEYNKNINDTDYSKINSENIIINEFKEIENIKVCFIYDVKGWAFYNMSNSLKKYLKNEYEVDILRYDEKINEEDYDIIFTFSPRVQPKGIRDKSKIICGISSYFGNPEEDIKDFPAVYTNDINIFNNIKHPQKYYAPNGVDTEFFYQENRSINYPTVIATIGSLQRAEHKGKERVELISKKLTERGYAVKNHSLFIDPTKKILNLDELKEFYKEIDIFIISSISETGPNTLLEALSMGIPVISNKVGLTENLIISGVSGYLIDSYQNIDEYVLAIENLINNPNLYKKMSEYSKLVIKEYDWENRSKDFSNIINLFLKNNL
jgi:glycosyltransferase involved in cell wall biosynthesis